MEVDRLECMLQYAAIGQPPKNNIRNLIMRSKMLMMNSRSFDKLQIINIDLSSRNMHVNEPLQINLSSSVHVNLLYLSLASFIFSRYLAMPG